MMDGGFSKHTPGGVLLCGVLPPANTEIEEEQPEVHLAAETEFGQCVANVCFDSFWRDYEGFGDL